MKIGILTINEGANYGNRLQNYAMQVLLSSIGCESQTIKRISDRDKGGLSKYKRIIKNVLKQYKNHPQYDYYQSILDFNQLALKMIVKVPRPFLKTVLLSCVKWAEDNNCKLITPTEMKIINDKRSKEKSKI